MEPLRVHDLIYPALDLRIRETLGRMLPGASLGHWEAKGTMLPDSTTAERSYEVPFLTVRTSEGLFGMRFRRSQIEDFEKDAEGTAIDVWNEREKLL